MTYDIVATDPDRVIIYQNISKRKSFDGSYRLLKMDVAQITYS